MSELKTHECWVYDYGCRADMVNKSEADKVIKHQKYKRCLSMARWCMARYNEWAAYYPTTTTRKMRFLDKWEKRWLELAEKFKEAK